MLQPILGSFCGSNSTVQYLGLGFDSTEEGLLSHCRVKLAERGLDLCDVHF